MRSAIAFATLTLDIKHYKATEDDDRSKKDVERIDINQTLTGGIKGTTELRSLDWVEHSHYDHIFGNVMGKSRRVKLAEIEDEYLKTGWPEELVEEGLIESFVMSEENAWVATQVCPGGG